MCYPHVLLPTMIALAKLVLEHPELAPEVERLFAHMVAPPDELERMWERS